MSEPTDSLKSKRIVNRPIKRIHEVAFFSTPFGLYRDGTELRAVYYSKPDAARAACLSLGDRCDFPILMGMFHLMIDIRSIKT